MSYLRQCDLDLLFIVISRNTTASTLWWSCKPTIVNKESSIEITVWLLLLLTCALGAMSPGPSLVVVMQSCVAHGFRVGATLSVGHGVGVGLWALLTIVGTVTFMQRVPLVEFVLIVFGSFYLIYLGTSILKTLMHKPKVTDADNGAGLAPNAVRRNSFIKGFTLAFINPKLAVFFIALFSQFVSQSSTATENTIMIMTAMWVDILWYLFVCYALTVGQTRIHIDRYSGSISLCSALLLIVIGVGSLSSLIL